MKKKKIEMTIYLRINVIMNLELQNTLYMEKIDKNNIYIFKDFITYNKIYDMYEDYIY